MEKLRTAAADWLRRVLGNEGGDLLCAVCAAVPPGCASTDQETCDEWAGPMGCEEVEPLTYDPFRGYSGCPQVGAV